MRRRQADQLGKNLIEGSIACDHLDDARLFHKKEFGVLLDRDVSTDPDEADHVACAVLITDRDLGGGVPPGPDPFAMIEDRNPRPDEVLLAGEELFGLFNRMDIVIGLADQFRRTLQTVMTRDGLVGEDEAAVAVLDIDRLGKVADQEIDQQLNIDFGFFVLGDATEGHPASRTGAASDRRAGFELRTDELDFCEILNRTHHDPSSPSRWVDDLVHPASRIREAR